MKVLVAPLDWGLGHATRCVPVIREFLNQGAQVELAVVKSIASLYREIFPELRQHIAPSYRIVYPKYGFNMGLWLLKNGTHLNAVVKYEHVYAEKMVERHGFDILFSDNRFGFYSSKARSVYMTHQRRIAFPPMLSKFEGVGIRWHLARMKPFDEVWVPDVAEEPGYGGNLSHVSKAPDVLKFVGPLSRFSEMLPLEAKEKDLSVVAVVSGVEPARSRFEHQLRNILSKIEGNHVMILGRPSDIQESWKEGNIEFFNHLPTEQFADVVSRCNWVIARGGYSTVMDMAALGAKCVFVPTPGQYEQVVLAKNLTKARYAESIPASQFSESSLLQAFQSNVALPPIPTNPLLKDAVASLMKG